MNSSKNQTYPNNIIISSCRPTVASEMLENNNVLALLNKLFNYTIDNDVWYKTVCELNINTIDKSFYIILQDGVIKVYDNDAYRLGYVAIWYHGQFHQKLFTVEYNFIVNQISKFICAYNNVMKEGL